MSARLDELRRLRALLTEHLSWLDREIASLAADAPAQPAPPQPAPPPAGTPPPLRASMSPVNVDAEAILSEYRQAPVSIQKNARAGCFLYFAAALAAMGLAVLILYMLVKRAHGH